MKTIFHFSPFALGILLLFLCGCPQSKLDPANQVNQRPFAGVKLKLQVVDDPEMAKTIGRLRGEWSTQSGSDFEIIQCSEKELAEIETLSADAVICPSRLLAPLAEKKLLAELPEKIQSSSSWSDVFELPKLREASWAGKLYGLSFGSPVFTIYYRADLLKKLNRTPPKTWNEYQEIAKLLAAEKTSTPESPWHGTLEPLAPGWAGLMLLARAAPYAKHRDSYSTWFDAQTMEPLIANPPLVQSLTRIVGAAKTNSAESLKCDPSAVRRAFWAGQCGMAITWPTAAEPITAPDSADNPKSSHEDASQAIAKDTAADKSKNPQGELSQKPREKSEEFEVGFAELSGSRQVYNTTEQSWDARQEDESPSVPFLGIAGRLGVVNAKSTSLEAAFALLAWLSEGQNSRQICPVSSATTLFRKSHLEKPQLWTEKELSSQTATQYAEVTAATLNHETWLDLRLPGREKYLAALDEAVLEAVEGKSPPNTALTKAAEKWRQITEELGKERQKSAYLHSVGLE